MNIYYDTEFIDNGVIIELISIGMVREDGLEYYGIINNENTLIKAARDPWLKENVLSSLPLVQPVDWAYPVWDESHPDFANVKSKSRIALDVANFIRNTPSVSLWAWFSSYDHVVMAQLFGKMIHLPAGIPMRTNDVVQEVEQRLGNVRVPSMPGISQHNALSDAREVKWRHDWVKNEEMIRKYDKREPIPHLG